MKELDELLRVEVEAGKAGKGRVVVAVGEIGLGVYRSHTVDPHYRISEPRC